MAAPMTKAEQSTFLREILAPMFDALLERVKRAELRVAETERRMNSATGLRYLGTHDEGARYELGDAVTRGGSLWIARARTTSRPGADSTWQLAVKAGRDGKDAR